MKVFIETRNGAVGLLAVVVGFGGMAVRAKALTTYTFQPSSGDWNVASNWRDGNNQINGYPDGDDDDAIIPAGLTVRVDSTSVTGSIEVQQDVYGVRGVIIISSDEGELRLGNDRDVDSVVNGLVVFDGCPVPIYEACPTECPDYLCPAIIRLMKEEVTFTSDPGMNGEIRGKNIWYEPNWYYPDTPGDSGGYIFTKDNLPYVLHLEGSLRVVGHLGIYCALDNNATVMVDDPRGVGDEGECVCSEYYDRDLNCSCEGGYPTPELCFKDHMIVGGPDGAGAENFPITGTGDWICTGGTMRFERCTIDSAGDWLLTNPCPDLDGINHSLIEFNHTVEIDCLSGDFTIYGGKLKIRTDLQTDGSLVFYSPKNEVQPEIFVKEGKSAVFSNTCP